MYTSPDCPDEIIACADVTHPSRVTKLVMAVPAQSLASAASKG